MPPTTERSATATRASRSARTGCGSRASREADAYRRWVRDAGERLRPFSTGGSYINFQTADEDEQRIRATYGANFERLAAIKEAYDPGNLFRSNRNVRP